MYIQSIYLCFHNFAVTAMLNGTEYENNHNAKIECYSFMQCLLIVRGLRC